MLVKVGTSNDVMDTANLRSQSNTVYTRFTISDGSDALLGNLAISHDWVDPGRNERLEGVKDDARLCFGQRRSCQSQEGGHHQGGLQEGSCVHYVRGGIGEIR